MTTLAPDLLLDTISSHFWVKFTSPKNIPLNACNIIRPVYIFSLLERQISTLGLYKNFLLSSRLRFCSIIFFLLPSEWLEIHLLGEQYKSLFVISSIHNIAHLCATSHLKMEAVRFSKLLIVTCKTTQHDNQKTTADKVQLS